MNNEETLKAEVAAHPYPLVFATLSGAHLYGFASADSDYDLRGVHVLPAAEVLGLDAPRDTMEVSGKRDGKEIDLVTHDAKKFFSLLLKKNGYVLEQLYSPLVIHTTAAHDELRHIAGGCITRLHCKHYLGFADTEWKLFEKETPRKAKPLLYVYRVLLTGIHLMRTGRIEANLNVLNEEFRLPYIADLVAAKTQCGEKAFVAGVDVAFHRGEYERLKAQLEEEGRTSSLPQEASARGALSTLLVRLRMTTIEQQGR